MIDGKAVAYLDHRGLFVPQGIMYGGAITDAGPDWTIREAELSRDKEESHAQ